MNSNSKTGDLVSGSKKLALLPNYFKTVGIIIIILSFVAPVIMINLIDIEIFQTQKELVKYVLMNFVILGLVLIALASEKVEDDFTNSIRVKSGIFSFLSMIAYVILKPVNDFFLKSPDLDYDAQDLVLVMLFVYLILFLIQKQWKKVHRRKSEIWDKR
ncbi:MAG: hypothetical protein WKF70_07795 [Chitinophagaceae bacterium]